MEQKEFEDKLDGYADKISSAVSEGVDKVEEAFKKGRESMKADDPKKKRSRRGVVMVGIGVAWLLFTLGVLQHSLLPILLIILGIYIIVRDSNKERDRFPDEPKDTP